MENFIPAFSWQEVIIDPWAYNFWFSFWIVLMGFLVTAGCGLIGNYLLLRRMALVGDAISHSILPGLVVAFIIFQTASTWTAMIGALAAGIVTVAIIEFIHRQTRIKPDAAICIAFTVLFAIGVIMVTSLETQGSFHIDADCVLYGEIGFVPYEPPTVIGGVEIAPAPVLRMAILLVVAVACIVFFYKELLVTSFDPGLAKSLGMNVSIWHYGLMGALSLIIVGVFEAVGAILAVAMLIVPPMFAAQLSQRLSIRLVLTAVHAAISSLLGYHLSVWLACSAAGAMAASGALLFVLAWVATGIQRTLTHKAVVAAHSEKLAADVA